MARKNNNSFANLPVELIEQIITDPTISYVDVCHFCCVNHRFCDVLNNDNEIWRKKFKLSWPRLYDKAYSLSGFEKNKAREINWRDEVKTRHLFGIHLRSELSALSKEFYKEDEMSSE